MFLRGCGRIIEKLRDWKRDSQAPITENFKSHADQEKDSSIGKMGSIILVNGKMERNMEVDFGNLLKEIFILVNGKKVLSKVMGFIVLQTIKNLKESLSIS
eukprot:GHVR01087381.1.p1 GENE.GHVR01087381.1~~GHVR01087381.1.p1  ORF type:complete len:101 (+),score=6.05 GHVR01087381.1:1146-1448(+)